MWLDGQAMYEFDYTNCDEVIGPCDDSNAYHYTGPIEFENAIVYVNGTSLNWASAGQGPINTGQFLGIAFFTDSTFLSSLDNCQPLTWEGIDKIIGGDTIFSYKTNC